MTEFLATLFAILLVDPLSADIERAVKTARAPQAVVAQVQACTRKAGPAILERAGADPWWGATEALRLWAGWTTPEAVLVQAVPQCGAAVESARPFLASAGG